MDLLINADRALRDVLPGALTNLALELRSCRCSILRLEMEGVDLRRWEDCCREAVNIVDMQGFSWDVLYLGFFPGTTMVKRAVFRKFCPLCRENYLLEGSVGMGSIIAADRTASGGEGS